MPFFHTTKYLGDIEVTGKSYLKETNWKVAGSTVAVMDIDGQLYLGNKDKQYYHEDNLTKTEIDAMGINATQLGGQDPSWYAPVSRLADYLLLAGGEMSGEIYRRLSTLSIDTISAPVNGNVINVNTGSYDNSFDGLDHIFVFYLDMPLVDLELAGNGGYGVGVTRLKYTIDGGNELYHDFTDTLAIGGAVDTAPWSIPVYDIEIQLSGSGGSGNGDQVTVNITGGVNHVYYHEGNAKNWLDKDVGGDITGNVDITGTLRVHDGTDSGTIYFRSDRDDTKIYEDGYTIKMEAPSGLHFNYDSNQNGVGAFIVKEDATERMRIASGGNVGIGTSLPARLLSVNGIQGWEASDTEIAYLNPSATGADFKLGGNAGATSVRIDAREDGDTFFNSGGNVGIGTIAPTANLHIKTNTSGEVANVLKLHGDHGTNDGTEGTAIVFVSSTDAAAIGSRIAAKRKLAGAHMDLSFYTGRNAHAMTIDENQNIGIGLLVPTSKLHIYDSGVVQQKIQSSDNKAQLDIIGTYGQINNTAGNLYITNASTSYDTIFRTGSSVERMRLTYDGKVGIGTDSPDYKLEVVGDAITEAHIRSTGLESKLSLHSDEDGSGHSGGDMYIRSYGWGNAQMKLGAFTISQLDGMIKYENNAKDIGYTNIGNFGIGLNDPTYKLDVVGDIRGDDVRAEGSVYLNHNQLSSAAALYFGDSLSKTAHSLKFIDATQQFALTNDLITKGEIYQNEQSLDITKTYVPTGPTNVISVDTSGYVNDGLDRDIVVYLDMGIVDAGLDGGYGDGITRLKYTIDGGPERTADLLDTLGIGGAVDTEDWVLSIHNIIFQLSGTPGDGNGDQVTINITGGIDHVFYHSGNIPNYLNKDIGGTVAGDVIFTGDVTIEGTPLIVDATHVQIFDRVIELARGNTNTLTGYAGIAIRQYDGEFDGGILIDSTGEFRVGDITIEEDGSITNISTLALLARDEATNLDNDDIFTWDGTKAIGKTLSELGLALANGGTYNEIIVTNEHTTDVALTVSSILNTSAQLQLWKVDGTDVARVDSNGRFRTISGISNITTSNNAFLELPATGAVISRNITGTGTGLTVHLTHASASGNIAEFKKSNTTVAYIESDGTIVAKDFYGSSLSNGGSKNNAHVATGSNGTVISRNNANSEPVLIVEQINSGSTGNLQNWRFDGRDITWITKSGLIHTEGEIYQHSQDSSINIINVPDLGNVIKVNISSYDNLFDELNHTFVFYLDMALVDSGLDAGFGTGVTRLKYTVDGGSEQYTDLTDINGTGGDVTTTLFTLPNYDIEVYLDGDAGTSSGDQSTVAVTSHIDYIYYNSNNIPNYLNKDDGGTVDGNVTIIGDMAQTGSITRFIEDNNAADKLVEIIADKGDNTQDYWGLLAKNGSSTVEGTFKFQAKGDTSSYVDLMTIKATSGNVGIGTDTPNAKLHIKSTGANLLKLDRTASSYGPTLIFAEADIQQWALKHDADGNNLNKFHLMNGASDRVITFLQDGKIGFGTDTPTSKLSILDSTTTNENTDIKIWGYDTVTESAKYGRLLISTDGSFVIDAEDTYLQLQAANYIQSNVTHNFAGNILLGGDTNLTRHDANVLRTNDSFIVDINLGIGVTEPTEKLDVDGNIRIANSAKIYLWSGHDLNYIDHDTWTSSATGGLRLKNTASAGDVVLATNATDRLTVKHTTGNIGIGTTTPDYKLEVAGTVGIVDQLTLFDEAYKHVSTLSILETELPSSSNAINVDTSNYDNNVDEANHTFVFYLKVNLIDGQLGDGLNTLYYTVDGGVEKSTVLSDTNGITGAITTGIFTLLPYDIDVYLEGSGVMGENHQVTIDVTGGVNHLYYHEGNILNYLNKDIGGNVTGNVNVSGSIGIGTTSPTQKLEINVDNNGLNLPVYIRNLNGTHSDNGVGIGFNNESAGSVHSSKGSLFMERTDSYGRGKFHFLLNDTAEHDEIELSDSKMTIDFTGNVGIGTQSPNKKLHVSGISSISENDAPVFIQHNFPGTHGYGLVIGRDGSAATAAMSLGADSDINAVIASNSSDIVLGKSTSAVFSEHMRIQAAGNIGIGTASPNAKLHINGSNSGYEELLRFGAFGTDNDGGYIAFSSSANSGGILGSRIGGGRVGSGGTSYLKFDTYNAGYQNAMHINEDQNIGMGTTVPYSKLHLHDSTTNLMTFTNAASGAGGSDGFKLGLDTIGSIVWNKEETPLRFATSNTEAMRIDSDGNIGIGTDNPSAKLDILGTIKISGGYLIDSAHSLRINTQQSQPLIVSHSGSENMRITSDGDVGLGTTNPDYKLEVVGNVGILERLTLFDEAYKHASTLNISKVPLPLIDNVIHVDTSNYDNTVDGGDHTFVFYLKTDLIDGELGDGITTLYYTIDGGVERSTTLNDTNSIPGVITTGIYNASYDIDVYLDGAANAGNTDQVTINVIGGLEHLYYHEGNLPNFLNVDEGGAVSGTLNVTDGITVGGTSTLNEVTITNDDTGTPPLIINAMSGTTANIQSWRVNNVTLARINQNGFIYSPGLVNSTSSNNSVIYMDNSGTRIRRNIADSEPALKIDLGNASATGSIVSYRAVGVEVASIERDGSVKTEGSYKYSTNARSQFNDVDQCIDFIFE